MTSLRLRSTARRRRGALTSAVALAGASALLVQGLAAPAAQAQSTSAQRAGRAAMTYVREHYRGRCGARVLRAEADVERGVPVYDVRTVAPNGTVYVVAVRRANNRVLRVSRAESQAGGCGTGSPTSRTHRRHA